MIILISIAVNLKEKKIASVYYITKHVTKIDYLLLKCYDKIRIIHKLLSTFIKLKARGSE